MEDDCSKKAANWWSNKIEAKSNWNYIPGLDEFEQQLALKIQKLTNLYGIIKISTSDGRSELLDQVSLSTGMNANIPNGYDMTVGLGKVFIYDSGNILSRQ